MPTRYLPAVLLSMGLGALPAFAETGSPPADFNREVSVLNGSLVSYTNSMSSGLRYRHVLDSGFAVTMGALAGGLGSSVPGTFGVVPVTMTTNWPMYIGGSLDTFGLSGASGLSLATALGIVGGIRLQIYQVTVIMEAHAPILQLGQLQGVTERLTIAMAGIGWRF